MVTQELINYINLQLQQGSSSSNIKQALLNSGWQQLDIDQAFLQIQDANSAPSPSITDSVLISTEVKKPSIGKTILVFLFFILIYPIGLVLMIIWMKWQTWVKIIVPIVMLFIAFAAWGVISALLLVAINPAQQMYKAHLADCTNQCKMNSSKSSCVATCMKPFTPSPSLQP